MANSTDNDFFKSAWDLCTSNNRLCPKPACWAELYKMLKDKTQKPSGGWEPSVPLILAAWHDTSPAEKQARFKEHIKWAADHNQIDDISEFLKSLNEDEWFHVNE